MACPICLETLEGNLATIGCCRQTMHVECLVKCMKQKLDCPLCRSRHESLRMIQDVESQVLVPVMVETRNQKFFRDTFVLTTAVSLIIVSYYGFF